MMMVSEGLSDKYTHLSLYIYIYIYPWIYIYIERECVCVNLLQIVTGDGIRRIGG